MPPAHFCSASAGHAHGPIKMSPTLPGPPLFGQATRVYEVEHRYSTVARIAFVVSRRFRQHAYYLLTVAEPGLSPAAMRVSMASVPRPTR